MDLDDIRERLDRRRSLDLFDTMCETEAGDEREVIAETLCWLNDPRLVRPLGALLVNRSKDEDLRRTASDILQEMTNSPDPDHDDLERLWNSGDMVLQCHALAFMTWRHEGLFAPILNDPKHPLYPDLLSVLTFAFPFPQFAAALITALNDPRPDVRQITTRSLAWNAPAAALDPLVTGLDDPDPEVCRQIIDTLKYYPSTRARAALEDLVGDDDLGAAVRETLAHYGGLAGNEAASDEMDEAENAVDGGDPKDTGRPDWLRSAAAFKKRFGNLDTCWAPLIEDLEAIQWDRVSRFARQEIADYLFESPDILVREHAPAAFAAWSDRRLRTLLEDRYFAVARAAGFHIRAASPVDGLPDQVWAQIKSASGAHACDLIDSLVALGGDTGWRERCAMVARDLYWEEAVRDRALNALYDDYAETGRGGDILDSIAAAIVGTGPVSGWTLHCTIVKRSRACGLDLPDLAPLQGVDHDPLKLAMAGLVTS